MRYGASIAAAGLLACHTALAQEEAAPLSAIDWLSTQSTPAALPQEPETSVSAKVPDVTVQTLSGPGARRVGLVPPSITGLPDTLWSGSDGASLAAQIAALPTVRLPALQQLTYTLLLAEAAPPIGDATQFDLARTDALLAFGALDPALALIEQAGPVASPAHFARFMDMSLIAGTEGTACRIMLNRPALSPSRAHEVFCTARAGDWNTAALILGTGRALQVIPTATADALDRFLDPDLFEGLPPLAVPQQPDPLLYRVHQAIGTPIPARVWPLVYANAELSDTVGWKAQIEAAERLAQKGTVPENRLLGLYTRRQPAASGGVWDRVEAVQRFDTALRTGSTAAVAKTLPEAWRAMGHAQLRVPFANLYAESLGAMVLSGPAADVAFEVILLSPSYTSALDAFPTRAGARPVLAGVARGAVPADLTADGPAGAVLAGFRDAEPSVAIMDTARSGAMGSALLDTLVLADAGSVGDVAQLSTAIATLRALGLEDVARRYALQVLLLERRG